MVALAEGRIGDVGEALLNESPLYGAVKGLSQMKSGTDLAPLMNAGIQGFNTASSIASGYNQSGAAGAGSALLGTAGFNGQTGISGFTARFGTFKSREEHTESYLSQLNAGRDVILSSGRDVNLIGGTQVDAGRNIVLDAARDLTIAANKDWTRYKSSSAGVSVGVSAGKQGVGITVGADGSAAKSNSETYTNARLTAGNALVFGSGRDTVVAGANLQARDIIGTVGGNLVVASVQNQLHSSNKSGSGSVTVGPAPGGSFSAASGKADRSFTDDVTSVIGTESVDIAVGGNTHVKGAVIANAENGVDKGNLVLSTGTLTFEDIIDSDKSQQKSISASFSKGGVDAQGKTVGAIPGVAGGSFSSSNTQGITRATVGNGLIVVREGELPPGEGAIRTDIANLNRDITNVQEITKSSEHTYSIAVPLATPEQIKSGAAEIKQAAPEIAKEINDAGVLNFANGVAFDLVPTKGNHGGLIMQIGALFNGDQTYIKSEVLGISDERIKQITKGEEKVTLAEEGGKTYLVLSNNERYEVVTEEYTHAEVAGNPDLLKGESKVFFNGILNSEEQAVRNGFLQLGSSEFLVSYDPTHGFWPDLVEVGLNKFGAPVGVQQQNNAFLSEFNGVNQGAFYAGHSAGGVRLYRGLASGTAKQFKLSKVQFSGTPVSNNSLFAATNFVTGNFPYVQNNPGDFVGYGLGWNWGTPGEVGESLVKAPLLFFSSVSPHSNYYCIACNISQNINSQ